MRIERLSNHQFKIFLTFDDLNERGFNKESLWIDLDNVRDLFSDMMYEASDEIGFELYGSLLIQVHLMQAQGMHIIVTQKVEDYEIDEDFIEMKVTLNESKELIFKFEEFEDIINGAHHLSSFSLIDAAIYYFNDHYYMIIEDQTESPDKEDLIAIMAEFSTPSITTSYLIKEYGKSIFQTNAIQEILHYFE
ncbi:genetic competence negative regulator [Virgibacillus sp. MSJ-26]|uniref:genetic competence negative regulator n=1 Tax=Virgibacillus sp. MSJ-26 TaxID=2841522 RepID=UPI001C0FAFAA|nr:genetic competence negative regulator [Virgibacillus sp. MSJ-26]MBU5466289.1 genetic competence negative regulator [Virgibacillus sp. MSJ-26]